MAATLVTLMIMVGVVVVCGGSPLSQRNLQEDKRGLHLDSANSNHLEKVLQARATRTERLAEDQREVISKQILQALSEIIQRDDCISDYKGWVDFGRRSTD